MFYRAQFNVHRMFNHHDVHEDKDYAYLVRCVERFRAALRSPQPHLFVLFSRARPGLEAPLRALAAALAEAGPANRLLAFLVDDTPAGRLAPEASLALDEPGLEVVRFASVSSWEPLAFADAIDEAVLGSLLRRHGARAPAAAGPT